MTKRYEFTGETKEHCGHTLRRIRAVVSFASVKKGEVGGWIETENNLSRYGNAWVCGDAEVSGNAKVCGNAWVCNDAKVSGNADYAVFKNCWSSMRWFTYTRSNKMWTVGCFRGTGDELIKKAYADSETSGRCYEAIVRAMETIEAATAKRDLIRKHKQQEEVDNDNPF